MNKAQAEVALAKVDVLDVRVDFVSEPVDACSFNYFLIAGYGPRQVRRKFCVVVAKPKAGRENDPPDVWNVNELVPVRTTGESEWTAPRKSLSRK